MTGRAVRAAGLYFAAAFGLGFVLGTVRVLVLEPGLGAVGAVLLELPVMLAFSWWIAGRIIRGCGVSAARKARLTMGGVAFALLMAAELALSALAFGQGLAGYLQHYQTLAGLLGLAGQVGFGLIPVARPISDSP